MKEARRLQEPKGGRGGWMDGGGGTMVYCKSWRERRGGGEEPEGRALEEGKARVMHVDE